MKKRKSLFILCCAAIAILSGVLIIVFNNEKKLDEYTYAAGGASRTLPLPSGSVYQDIGGMNMLTFKVKMHKEEVQAFYDDYFGGLKTVKVRTSYISDSPSSYDEYYYDPEQGWALKLNIFQENERGETLFIIYYDTNTTEWKFPEND